MHHEILLQKREGEGVAPHELFLGLGMVLEPLNEYLFRFIRLENCLEL